MTLFHTHQWKEVSRDYTPGVMVAKAYLSFLENIYQQPFTTHVYLKCETCGDIKQTDLIGNYKGTDKKLEE